VVARQHGLIKTSASLEFEDRDKTDSASRQRLKGSKRSSSPAPCR
jgi:hypothetical protein